MFLCVAVAFVAGIAVSHGTERTLVTFVPAGSTWRLWENVQAPASLWSASVFVDAGWRLGPAQFGHGDGDEATRIAPGVATHYFRHNFHVARAADFTNLLAQVLHDDGVVVYLNGEEVFRLNMPDGPVHHLTYASAQVSGTNETLYFPTNVSSSALVDGENTLAVELHQTEGPADASFDMSLIGIGPGEAGLPRLAAAHNSQGVALQWQGNDLLLEQLVLPGGSWETLTNAISPHVIPVPADSRLFRLRRK
jgi:hypothetical protein